MIVTAVIVFRLACVLHARIMLVSGVCYSLCLSLHCKLSNLLVVVNDEGADDDDVALHDTDYAACSAARVLRVSLRVCEVQL